MVRVKSRKLRVAPLVGAWIETDELGFHPRYKLSHPSWVRGLKPCPLRCTLNLVAVAPLVGAWIETDLVRIIKLQYNVAPLVGAWIETASSVGTGATASRTPRGCVD